MQIKPFNDNWIFCPDGGKKIKVMLPHDAMKEDITEYGFQFSSSEVFIYEKKWTAQYAYEKKHVELYFEGISGKANIYINGKIIACVEEDFSDFYVDLSNVYIPYHENTIKVMVSSKNTQRADLGAGIVRPVSLVISEGEYIRDTQIEFKTLCIYPVLAKCYVDDELPASWEIYNQNGELEISGQNDSVLFQSAILWTEKNPYVYNYKVKRNGEETRGEYAIRQIKYINDSFRVNGRVFIPNCCVLTNFNGLPGAASIKESEWRRVRLLKNEGFNTVRFEGIKPSKEFVRACKHYGVLIEGIDYDKIPFTKVTEMFTERGRLNTLGFPNPNFENNSVVKKAFGIFGKKKREKTPLHRASRIEVIEEEVSNREADNDIRFAMVKILDEEGNIFPEGEYDITADAEGGEILFMGSEGSDREYHVASCRSTNGRAQIILRKYKSSTVNLNINSNLGEMSIVVS